MGGERAVVASVLLLGCAGVERDGGGGDAGHRANQNQECHSASCKVDVDVTCNDGSCTGTVDPKVLLINHGHDNQIIMWMLNTAGFEFPADGVSFEKPDWACDKQSKQKFKCTNAHYRKDVFVYTVTVTNVAHPADVVPVDPWIVNN